MARSISGPVGMQGISIPRRKEEKGRKILNFVVGMLQIGIKAWLQHLAFLGS
jgi:hypothetical protein